MPDVAEQPAKHGRSLGGFYIALGVVTALVTLGAVLWKPLHRAYSERAVTRAFLKAMDRRVEVDLKDVPAKEGLQYLVGMIDVGVVSISLMGNERPAPMPKVTLQFKNVSIAAILDSWCRQTNLDWTIAPSNFAPPGRHMAVVITGQSGRIAELERANPWVASLVRQYRKELATQEPPK